MKRHEFKAAPCRRQGVDAIAARSIHSFSRHSHDQFGIGAIDRGGQKSLSCCGVVEAVEGDTITVNPGEIHDGAPIGGERSWRMLYLDTAIVEEIVLDLSEGRTKEYEFVSPVIRNGDVTRRVRRIFSLLTAPSTPKVEMQVEELLTALFETVMRDKKIDTLENGTPTAIAHAISLMRDDPTNAFSLGALAREAGLSRYQFLRAIKKATGLTPHAFLLQLRTDMAKRLIAAGVQLAEAAAASGFSDQSHMHRVFVKKYGLTPGAYADLTR